jgi:hypothetical protein
MKKYRVTLSQTYCEPFAVTIQVNSPLTLEELENEISDITSKGNIARLSEEELINTGIISGYVEGTYSTWEGDSDPVGEVEVIVEETDD